MMRFRIGMLALAVLCILAGVVKAEQRHREEINRVRVDSFNDGFLGGACRNGTDGFGNVCQEG